MVLSLNFTPDGAQDFQENQKQSTLSGEHGGINCRIYFILKSSMYGIDSNSLRAIFTLRVPTASQMPFLMSKAAFARTT